MNASKVLFRLELADALRSRWLVFTAAIYALVFGGFVWLGLRESTVMGFTGMSRVVLNVSIAVVLAVPLVALVATSQVIVKARQSGFFELMLSQPVRRAQWFGAAVGSRLVVIVGPLVVLFLLAIASVPEVGKVTLVPAVRVIASALLPIHCPMTKSGPNRAFDDP